MVAGSGAAGFVAGFGIGILPNSTTADLIGSGSGPFRPPMMFSAVVGTLKFGAFGIGTEEALIWRMKGFGAGAGVGAGDAMGTGFFPIPENSSSDGVIFSVISFADSCFEADGTITEIFVAGAVKGTGIGVEMGTLETAWISSRTFGAGATGFVMGISNLSNKARSIS